MDREFTKHSNSLNKIALNLRGVTLFYEKTKQDHLNLGHVLYSQD